MNKIINKYRKFATIVSSRKPLVMKSNDHYISFTFDDFPKSSYLNGGSILKKYGLTGTYYVSLSLMNKKSHYGKLYDNDILRDLLLNGHEIGCHTYSHADAWQTKPEIFEESILQNRETLNKLFPMVELNTFAYPMGNATPETKNIAGKYFKCCRGGNQTLNSGKIDLNCLNAYFLDKRKKDNISNIKNIIDINFHKKGWLIFATHDIEDSPSDYGNTPHFLEEVILYSIRSGAVIATVNNVYNSLTVK